MATISMEGLWTFLQSMALTDSNKVWLAERLVNDVPARSMEDRCILDGVKEAVEYMNQVRQGIAQPMELDDFLDEVEREMATAS